MSSSSLPNSNLNDLANYDSPTGLPGRRLFFDRLNQAVHRADREHQVASVFFVRIDRLKIINDTFGKGVGNEILVELSNRFQQALRTTDNLGRPGRDEFMVLLPQIAHEEDAAIVANKLLDCLHVPFEVSGKSLLFNANIGISLFPKDTSVPEELLSQAYTAMIGASDVGKNTFRYFSPEINERAYKLLELETELRLALERSEFRLQYQPVLCLKSSTITAMEALVRWKHPTRGMLGPDHFINVAENSEMINRIGSWVMDTAFAQNRRWHESGIQDCRMAINLSARQFSSMTLVDEIRMMLDTHLMDPSRVEIEVTENSLIHATSDTKKKFRALKDLGVSLALDDFGTGYSSLSYLKDLPFDRVKIDRSFIKNICDDPKDAAIASAIVQMAHALDMKVTGEGVEHCQQLELLRSMGCDEVQGYYFSTPVNSHDMEALLSSRTTYGLNEQSTVRLVAH